MAKIKTLTIDGFYRSDEAENIFKIIRELRFEDFDLGKDMTNFNMVANNASDLFSRVLGFSVTVDQERSGVFRRPDHFIHFEECERVEEWIFFVAITNTIFNIYEHSSGAENALQGYKFNYRNLFEWNHMVGYNLKPGQGIFVRPWIFHSIISDMVQMFRVTENGH